MPFANLHLDKLITAVLMSLPCLVLAAPSLREANNQTRRFVQQTMTEATHPRPTGAVVKDGRIVLSESYGYANVENQVPVTAKTRFPLNTATKAFTGVALMQLAQDGRVYLAAPASRYLDDLPMAWRAIPVRQLLGHTSGLPDLFDPRGSIVGATEAEAWQAVKASSSMRGRISCRNELTLRPQAYWR